MSLLNNTLDDSIFRVFQELFLTGLPVQKGGQIIRTWKRKESQYILRYRRMCGGLVLTYRPS